MKRVLVIFILLFAFGITTPLLAQRRREHKNQRRGGSSRAHIKKTNSFAYGGSTKKKGKGAKVVGGWVYKPTRPGKKQNREQPHLFSRTRTNNRKYKDGLQARINRERVKRRVRGNATFHKSKYF
ncbi:MAG: hypothetical protein JNK50_03295 [Bacteroidia bacterium]|nr:hypothetical protein [Bacteroidia bacterium]